MPHEALTTLALALVALNGIAIVVGIIVVTRDVREVARLARAVAGLIIQEEAKTRAEIRTATDRP